ncbi:uncharacterized protein LOC101855468 [Aplysia californica]|uniref:Uncharacterized protein LOC101855468 n=1 Tax=Aplysia californica TaxID=6500 RepID=A0ABM0JFQ1_APLCA|nr:uncharacterized protein LOC101855468 [Aplysia californica]
MRITHSDSSSQCLQFRWSCVHSPGRVPATPRGRSQHASCALHRYLYVSGGKERYSPLKDFWRLDMITLKWETVKITNMNLPHLQGHTMLPHKSQLLIFGGTFFENDDDSPLLIYSTDLNMLRAVNYDSSQERPGGCREHSAVIHKGFMYIYGGFTDSSGSINEFWAFDIAKENWKHLSGSKPGKRHGHIAVTYESLMLVHGGMKDLMALADLWSYDFALHTWSRIKGTGTCPTLSGHSANVVNQYMILVGGSKHGHLSHEVWLFNFETGCWRQVLTPGGEFFAPTSLHTSVLLKAPSLNEVVVDRTMSVPQLKATPTSLATPIRPWTSPAVSSSGASGVPSSSSDHHINILRLSSSQVTSDKNNNSQENLCSSGIDSQIPFHSSDQINFQTDLDNSQCSGFDHSFMEMKQTTPTSQPHPETFELQSFNSKPTGQSLRIRPASSEFCGTGLPLLERFQSVSSDADIGLDNPTLTLSDEHLPIVKQTYSLHMDSLSPCFEENQSNVSPSHGISSGSVIWSHQTQSHPVSDCCDTSDIFRSSGISCARNNNTFNRSSSQVEYDDKLNRMNETDSSFPANRLSDRFPQLLFSGSSPPSCGIESGLYVARKSRYIQDLFVEDLEQIDNDSLIQNVSIAYPSSSGQKSASLRDICNFSSNIRGGDSMESFIYQNGTQKKTNLCVNVTAKQMGSLAVKSRSYSSVHDNTENWDTATSSFMGSSQRHNTSGIKVPSVRGKYAKHMGNAGSKNHISHRLKNSPRIFESAKTSVATQTGSQSSVNQLPSACIASNAPRCYDHFMALAADDKSQGEKSTGSSNSEHTESTSQSLQDKSAVLGGSEVALLVIGGHRDNHCFHSEPLKLLKCHLY